MINMDHGTIVLFGNGDEVAPDFNKILLDFLEVDMDKSFLVMTNLGYDLQQFNIQMSLERTNMKLRTVGAKEETKVDGKEKSVLLAVIDLRLELRGAKEWDKWPGQVADELQTILAAVTELNKASPTSATPEEVRDQFQVVSPPFCNLVLGAGVECPHGGAEERVDQEGHLPHPDPHL